MITLFSTALKWMASAPPATHVAPIRPPKSACEELEGSPRYQVTRFHKMAPTSPAKITTGLMSVSSTSPPEIVLATWTDRKAPVRFRQAGTGTAVLGRNATDAIGVAMALAVSWKPFVKSKANAVTTTTTTISDTSIDRTLRSADRNPAGCWRRVVWALQVPERRVTATPSRAHHPSRASAGLRRRARGTVRGRHRAGSCRNTAARDSGAGGPRGTDGHKAGDP